MFGKRKRKLGRKERHNLGGENREEIKTLIVFGIGDQNSVP